MTKTMQRRLVLAIALIPMLLFLGCAGLEWSPKYATWYYHPELPAADKAVKAAQAAGKDKECPNDYAEAAKMLSDSYTLYKMCKTQEAIELANKAKEKANSLCPAPPDPCEVCRKCPDCKKPAPAPVEKEAKFTIDSAHFDFNKYTIKTEEKGKTAANIESLKKAVDFIKSHKTNKVLVEGNTDNVGSYKYNMRLGMKRAEAVKQALVKGGVDPKMIKTVSYGYTRPVASNKTAEGRAKNRRSEITVKYME